MAKKFRVGIIASGRIARAHGQGWTECNRTEIVAIADSHPEALASYAEDFNIKSQYLDYREMMEKEDLDIVSVCSWNPQHAEMTNRSSGPQAPSDIMRETDGLLAGRSRSDDDCL